MNSERDMIQLGLCISLAHYAHLGQVDKAGKRYIDHPLRVMERVSHVHEKMAAVLHDTVEDTWVDLELLDRIGLPYTVINAVDALTRRPNEEHELYLDRVKCDPIAVAVKIADLLDNLDPQRMTAWSALGLKEARSATLYAKHSRKRLEELCRYAGREVPNV